MAVVAAIVLYCTGRADRPTSKLLVISAIVAALLISGCATQPPPPASAPVVMQTPRPKPSRHVITAAEILAAQPPEVQTIIKQHKRGRWPTIRRDNTVLYPYSPDADPIINTRFGQTTDIALEPGETVTDITLGDQRFVAWPEASGDPSHPMAHVVVEPNQDGIEGSLTIYTTRRVIHCALRTHRPAMQQVELYDPDSILQQMASADLAAQNPGGADADSEAPDALPDVDPSHLNFAYAVSGSHLAWTPERVFDDGTHVYLQMPPQMQTASAPALLLDGDAGRQMVNYRVVPNSDGGSYYVVDRLFDKAELLSGVGRKQDIVTITYAGAER